jgi:DNA-binding MarR family transcriptional regulator
VLQGVSAAFECTREGEHDGGDHRIIIGRVTRALRFERAPLLFCQGAYRVQAEHPADTARQAASLDTGPIDIEGSTLQVLFRANHRLAAAFAHYRGSLTRDEHRVLISIEKKPAMTAAQVAEHAFLGTHAVDDAVSSLLAQGLLSRDGGGQLSLTEAGRERRRELVGHLKEMEHRVFAGIPAQTLEVGRDLLRRLAVD